jgi:kojibiose phosphorylase
MVDSWSIAETAFAVATAKAYEGLFTIGSGYLHLRGSLEEHLADAPQNSREPRRPTNVTAEKFVLQKAKWGTYVPGVFGAHPFLNEEMVNLPWFLGLAPSVGGERLDLERSRVTDYRRELDLHTATLRRSLKWHTRAGAVVTVTFERFVSAARPALCVQRLTLSSDRPVAVAIEAGLDADVTTNGFDHFTKVEVSAKTSATGGDLAVTVVTNGGDTVRTVSRVIAPRSEWAGTSDARSATLRTELSLPANGTLVIEKRSAVATSRDLTKSPPEAMLAAAAGSTYDQLLAEHTALWAERWEKSDVVVEGDPAAQIALRASLFHLLRAHVTGDPRVAIDAKGYAGEAYYGRYFWDTEMYLLPFFLYTDPERARTLVDFRVSTLPGARANAQRYGYPGARFAWESDALGGDCCPLWQYGDHEIHVTADVAYAMAHYQRATGDPAYLRGPAATVIVETARYWMQRIDQRPGDDHPSLLGVMGPNEYQPLADNNAYTNRLVRFALALAADVGAAGGATPEERKAFAQTAAALPILRGADGVLVLENEGFERLMEPRYEQLWKDRSKPFAAQVSQERIYRCKCLKQGDVIMLMLLFPHEFTDVEVRRAWDYYLPYTTHDSSLSAGAHAIVALRLGLFNEARQFWQRGSNQDLDLAHGGAAEGIHIAGAGANWMMAVFGFAGVATALQAEVLTLRPRLPDGWKRLAFPLVWKQVPVSIEIVPGSTTIANRGQVKLEVCVHGAKRTIAAGEKKTFAQPA